MFLFFLIFPLIPDIFKFLYYTGISLQWRNMKGEKVTTKVAFIWKTNPYLVIHSARLTFNVSYANQNRWRLISWNAPFPSCLVSLFQSEAKCTTFRMKMSFIYMWMKTHFHMEGYAPRLALKKEEQHNSDQQWPLELPSLHLGAFKPCIL